MRLLRPNENVLLRFSLKKDTTEIYNDLTEVAGSSAPSDRTVRRWIEEFRAGRRSVEDMPRSGRPSSAITEETVLNVEKLVTRDPNASIDEIAQEVGISHGSVHTILLDRLRMRKICSRWSEGGESGTCQVSHQQNASLGR